MPRNCAPRQLVPLSAAADEPGERVVGHQLAEEELEQAFVAQLVQLGALLEPHG